MQSLNELLNMANQIESLESQAAHITDSWYQFNPSDEGQVEQVSDLSRRTSQILEQLSGKLDAQLRRQQTSPGNRQNLQYAYNLVQELLQSRQATLEMTSTILTQADTAYQEYLRALALKEKAAAEQVDKLVNTLVNIYDG